MERSGRRSLLQTEILAHLRKESVDSVSALARSLEKSRPAVSRALKTLSDQGFVQRVGRSWNLTELGSAEAEKAVARLQESTADIVEVAGQRFRAMNRAGLGDTLSASMTSLIGSGLAGAATAMLAEEVIPRMALMTEAMIPERSAIDASSSIGSVQETLANLVGISGLTGEVSGLGVRAMGGEFFGSAMREAAGLSVSQSAAEELLASFGSGLAFEPASNLGSISAGFVAGELTRQLGFSLADRMAELFDANVGLITDYSAFLSPDYSTLLGTDFSALSKSVDVITASREDWPLSFVGAASALAEWEEPFAAAITSYHEDNAANFADILSGLAHVDLPEPLLTDALRVYGLNSERIHTPTYWIPPVEPLESLTEAMLRASAARRRRINDAADTLVALEEGIRSLIATQLGKRRGSAWWNRSVPSKIQKGCERRKRSREAAGGLNHNLIDYTFTSELKEIIVEDDNWDMAFSSIFRNKTQVDAVFLWIEPVRKDIAHSRPSSDRDYKQFKFAATWLMDAAADALEEDAETDAAD